MQEQPPLTPEQINAINHYRDNEARKTRAQTQNMDKPFKPRQKLGEKLKSGTLTRRDMMRK